MWQIKSIEENGKINKKEGIGVGWRDEEVRVSEYDRERKRERG